MYVFNSLRGILKLELTYSYHTFRCWIKSYTIYMYFKTFHYNVDILMFLLRCCDNRELSRFKYLFMFVIWSFLAPLSSGHEVWTYNDQKNQNHLITLQCILFSPASRLPHSFTTEIWWLIFRLKTWVCTKTAGSRWWSVSNWGAQNNHQFPGWCKWLSSFEQH